MDNELPLWWVLGCGVLAMFGAWVGWPHWVLVGLLLLAGVPFVLTSLDL